MKNRHYPGEMPSAWDWIGGILIVVLMVALAGYALVQGGKAIVAGISFAEARRATAECEQWQDEAKVYPAYFIVQWQKDQCDTYGITIDAPLKTYSRQ